MEYLKIIITSFVSLVVLFILTKLLGNKQLSDLNMFDYIISITIGSIAAEMATDIENPEKSLIAMIVYALVSYGISILTLKVLPLRRLIFGKSSVLMQNGKLYRENFKKCGLDINEFLMQSRLNGYYDLSSVKTAIMESNGKISFLPYSKSKPVTAVDLGINSSDDQVQYNIIMDGEVLDKNLQYSGFDNIWLNKQLKNQGIKNISDVFLATLDNTGKLTVYKKYDYEEKNDYFQ